MCISNIVVIGVGGVGGRGWWCGFWGWWCGWLGLVVCVVGLVVRMVWASGEGDYVGRFGVDLNTCTTLLNTKIYQ